MGGCCSSSKHELSRTSIYTYCPERLEHGRMSNDHGAMSVLPTGLLVIQNMDITIPDSYTTPPLPSPFSLRFNSSEPLSPGFETSSEKSDRVLREITFEGFSNLKLPNFKVSEDKSSELDGFDNSKVEEEEDVCPTCLEEYSIENPRIIAKCQHHFHLSCIFEWKERSDTCPVCDQLMVIDYTCNV